MFAAFSAGVPAWKVVDTVVKYVDEAGNEHCVRDDKWESVLATHAEHWRIVQFQNEVVQFQQKCRDWRQHGFDVPSVDIPLPLRKTIHTDGTNCSLAVQDPQDIGEVEHDDETSWFFRKTFYTMTREDRSTTTFFVLEKLEKFRPF